MRFALMLTTLWTLAAMTPARALGTLQNCDAIKDMGARMTCMQAHISSLEETLLTLSNRIISLDKQLEEKLDAAAVYKLQYVGSGSCFGFAGKDEAPVVVTCDHPDSWKLLSGAQKPGSRGKPRSGSDDSDKSQTSEKKDDDPKSGDSDKSQKPEKKKDKPKSGDSDKKQKSEKESDQPKSAPPAQ